MSHTGFLSGLRARLIGLVLFAAIPAVGLTLYIARHSGEFAAHHTLEDAKGLVRLAALDYERLVESSRHLLRTLAQLSDIRTHNANACHNLLVNLKTGYPHYANLGAIRPDGRIFCSAEPMPKSVNVTDRDYFRRAVATRGFAAGDYQIGRITGKPVLVLNYPAYDKQGRLQVMVFAALDLTWLNQLTPKIQFPSGSTLLVIDEHGTILNRWPNPEKWIGKLYENLPLKQAILSTQAEGYIETADFDGVQRLYAFAPLRTDASDHKAYISIGIPRDVAYAEIGRILTRTLAGLALVIVLTLVAAWLGGDYFLLRRIRGLVEAARRLGQGDLDTRTGLRHGRDEIGILARSFDEMAENLQAREIETQRARETIERMAYHDELTGLPNRTLLLDRIKQAIIEAARHRRQVAILCLDIDRFKFINETYGHGAGDTVLKTVTEHLGACVRPGDTVARLGGDEFAIALLDVAQPEDIGMLVQKIMRCSAEPLTVAGNEVFLSISLGVALYPLDGADPETLLKNADLALSLAQEQGSGYQYYSSQMASSAAEHLALENGLRHALERNEFLLHYQPQVDVRSGKVTGVEALIRWRRPGEGLVSPIRFIPLAEETGLIVPIGEWVLKAACGQIRAWRKAGLKPVRVAVNISTHQLKKPGLDDTIKRILQESGVDPHLLEIELTESALAENPELVSRILGNLEKLGVRISIDDFGTGYSSLSYLKRFTVDMLKIDQSFVRDITTDPDDAAIVMAIIGMAHALGIQTIAEGVETQEQLEFLRKHGCDAMQGYYFSRPIPAEEIAELLKGNLRLLPLRKHPPQ